MAQASPTPLPEVSIKAKHQEVQNIDSHILGQLSDVIHYISSYSYFHMSCS